MSKQTYINNAFVNDDGKSKSTDNGVYEKSKVFQLETIEKAQNDYQIEKDYDPFEHRQVEHPLTNTETLVHLLKSALGTGIFAIPNAFSRAGYVVGLVSTIIIGLLCTYCVHMIINMQYALCKKKRVPSMNYPLVGEAAILAGPKPFHKFAPIMIHIINSFLIIYQVGSCCVYVVFIAENIKALLDYAFSTKIEIRLIMLVILLPLVLINWIRNLKYLAPLSTIGNIVTLLSFGIICYYIFRDPITLEGKDPYRPISEYPMYFGTVLFALEAIGVIMPLENEMKTPKDFRGTTGILNQSMFIVVSLYIGLGLCGYLRYGTDIKPSITLNLLDNEILGQLAKGMIAFGVFITHAVACYVAIDITWNQYCDRKVKDDSKKTLWEYILRTSIVFFTFVMAVLIPNLEMFISLIGALALSTLGILFPALLDTCANWYNKTGYAKAFMIIKNVLIGIVGLAGFIIGTSLSLRDIIKEYS